jgi:hypothetical protein
LKEQIEMLGREEGWAASNTKDGAGIVDVDGGGTGNSGEARHEHHVAGDDDDMNDRGLRHIAVSLDSKKKGAGRKTYAVL